MKKLLFVANDGSNGYEYYLTDGTATGATELLRNIGSGSSSGAPVDIDPTTGRATYAGDVAQLPGLFFFTATSAQTGLELWVSDGTTAGTQVLETYPGPGSADVVDLAAANGRVFFYADSPDIGRELWMTDGTSEGTQLVSDIWSGSKDGFIKNQADWVRLESFKGGVVFVADDGTSGAELWFSNGTTTRLIKDIKANDSPLSVNNGSRPEGIMGDGSSVVGDKLFFTADNGVNGRELWVTDGSEEGTTLVRDIRFGNLGSDPRDLQAFGDLLYFTADDGVTGRELWVTDGTSAGTRLVDLRPGDRSSDPSGFTVFDGSLIFSASNGTNGPEPYIIREPGGEPTLLRDIRSGAAGSIPTEFTASDDYLVFAGIDPQGNGRELFVSDGTSFGTSLLEDIAPGTVSSSPGDFVNFDGRVFFAAETTLRGRELWVTDGTDTGTSLFAELAISTSSSNPIPLAVVLDPDLDTGGGQNLPPAVPVLSAATIAEDAEPGTVVGTLSATDPDGDILTFRLLENPGDLFAIEGDTLVLAGTLDFETAAEHAVTIEADDGRGGSAVLSVTVAVEDANEAPDSIELSNTLVGDGQEVGSVLGVLSATDPNGDPVSFTLTDDAGGLFALDVDGVSILVNGAIDVEQQDTFEIAVEADDGNGGVLSETIVIGVTEANQVIDSIDLIGGVIAEDAEPGALVGRIQAEDPDGDALVFSLVDDAGGLFELAENGLDLVVAGPLDFETAASETVIVRADDGRGGIFDQTLTIEIGDVDEGPGGGPTEGLRLLLPVAETAAIGTVLLSFIATDSAGNPIALSLSDDFEGLFEIGENGTDLMLASPLDFETAAEHTLTVTATAIEPAATGDEPLVLTQSFTIQVLDMPEIVEGTDGDDILFGEDGVDDTIIGGAGVDTVVYDRARADIEETVNADGSITVRIGDETDTLTGIERIELSDGVYRYDLDGTGGELAFAYRLYKASVARDPDEVGLSFWLGELSEGRETRASLAEEFVRSTEFRVAFPEDVPDDAFIESYFQNVLGRESDAAGKAFWLGRFEDGAGKEDLLLAFADSDEFVEANADNYDDGVFLI